MFLFSILLVWIGLSVFQVHGFGCVLEASLVIFNKFGKKKKYHLQFKIFMNYRAEQSRSEVSSHFWLPQGFNDSLSCSKISLLWGTLVWEISCSCRRRRLKSNNNTRQIWSLVKQFGNWTCLCSALDSVQSVHTSKSKHVSAGRKKLTQWSITATRNTVQGFWVTIRGSNLFQQREGKAAPSLANLWLERASHLCTFPLIPQLTKHCAVSVSDMLCLSGHLDMHLVSQGVCLSVAVPDGRALITVSYVSKSWAANADFWGSLDVSEGLCCNEWVEWNAD